LIAGEAGIVRMLAKGFSPDEEVAEVFACGEGLGAEVLVGEGDRLAVRDAETIVDALLERHLVWRVGCAAARAGVNGFLFRVFVGRVHRAGQVFAAAMTGVDVPGDQELIEGFAVEREAL
jgi:hypothetical protein